MSDASGQQREFRPRLRPARPEAPSNLAPGADDHLDEETSAAFALGALDGLERDLVEFHIRFCQRCAAIAERDLQTTGFLPFVVAPAVPPLDVKAALFARIGHTQRLTVSVAPPVAEAPSVLRSLTLPASYPVAPGAGTAAPVAAAAAVPGRSFGRVGSVLSVPLLVALVATGFWGFQLQDRLATQGSRVNALEAQVANFGAGETIQFQPGTGMPQAQGQLLLGANELAGMLDVDLNSDAAAGTYEVWGVDESGNLGPITELQVGDDGKGQAQFTLDQPYSTYESVQIVPKATALDGEARQDAVVLQLGNQQMGSTGSALAPMP